MRKNKMTDDLKNFIKKLNLEIDDNFVSKLQEINGKFITEYKIQINYNNKLTMIPIETEIYFSKVSSDKADDGMCHMNELQKGFVKYENCEEKERFGQLYFHRKGISKNNKILCANSKTTWGGVDVCLSDSQDYCLSILIRSALFINKIKEDKLVSGTRNICDEIKENCFDKSEENLQSFFKNLEKNEDNKVRIVKRNDDEQNNIFFQPRIVGKTYHKGTKIYELNCLNLGEYNDKEYKYKYKYLQSIIDTKQNFYKKKENINYILTKYKQQSTN